MQPAAAPPLPVRIGVASLDELALFEAWAAQEGWHPCAGARRSAVLPRSATHSDAVF
jgi:hypothetical protein